MSLLKIDNLSIIHRDKQQTLVRNVSFEVRKGQCVGIVGASGSGKSLTCRSIIGVNPPALVHSGDIFLDSKKISNLSDETLRLLRGKRICMIFQNGMDAFNPSRTLRMHFRETMMSHYDLTTKQIDEKAIVVLKRLKLDEAERLLNSYPHELSGGMLQRMMIATAILLEPDLIIADEPTTALDTISQYEVMEELNRLRQMTDAALLFVSHDLGVIKKIANYVIVMNEGEIIESNVTDTLFRHPTQEFTKQLIETRIAISKRFNQVIGRREISDSGS